MQITQRLFKVNHSKKVGHILYKGLSASVILLSIRCTSTPHSSITFKAMYRIDCYTEHKKNMSLYICIKIWVYCSWALCVEKPLLCRWFLVINTLLRPTEEITFSHNQIHWLQQVYKDVWGEVWPFFVLVQHTWVQYGRIDDL